APTHLAPGSNAAAEPAAADPAEAARQPAVADPAEAARQPAVADPAAADPAAAARQPGPSGRWARRSRRLWWTRPGRPRGRARVAGAVVVVAGLLAASVVGAGAVLRARLPRHPLPDFRGQPVATASRRLASLKVRIDRIPRFDDKVPADHVVDQRPPPGRRVREGSLVHLVVSKGATPVPVPDLAALTRADATARLTAAGFVPGAVSQQASETVVAGAVLDWSGRGGQLPRGSKVDLVVSSGPPVVTVADVRNKPLADALAALQAEGLVPVRTANGFDDNVPEGQVIATAPAGGTTAPKGSQVQVTVSKGPEFVAVPDVRNLSVEDATARLAQVHLGVAGAFGPQRRRVLDTDPPPGARIHSGGSVNLFTH
ncbi:MAG: PASTA domain-containing protein, partial [Acidimicrobiales bacterium]